MTSKSLAQRLILFCLLFAALALLPIFALAAAQCEPPECYPTDVPYEMPEEPAGGAWGGYSDGRLNPDMAEYYSVWCANDLIEVWGGVPTPQLVNTIPIVEVLALGDSGSFDAGNGMTVTRVGDTVTLYGSSGYNAPNPGSKSFSLSECIARNGGVPEAPEQPPPPAQNPPPEEESPPPAGAEEATSNVWLCLPGVDSMADFIRCLNFFAPDSAAADYYYSIAWAIATFCAGGFAPAAVIALPALRRWRRRR